MLNTILTIANIIALVAVPIIAVWVGQFLQNRAAKRKDKMVIFQCLMTNRATGWANQDTVNALNSIDIVFCDDKEVRKRWAELLSKYKPSFTTQEKYLAQCKLLEAMAKALGYGKKITWETIQTPYLPEALLQRMDNAAKYESGQLAMADFVMNMIGNSAAAGNTMPQQGVKQEDTPHADA